MSKLISERKFGIVFMVVMTLLLIVLIIFMVNSEYPEIKHKLLTSGIMIGIFAIGMLCGLVYICRKAPFSRFKSMSNLSKIYYSMIYLVLSVGIIWCIEYMIYQKNMDQFIIEQEYLNESMRDRANSINAELELYQTYESVYTGIANEILQEEKYRTIKLKNKLYLPVESDTIVLHLNKIGSHPPRTMFSRNKDEIDLQGARSIGVSISNEPYNLSHPSSREILNQLKKDGVVRGEELIELINQKIAFYHQRCANFEVLLNNEDTISFISFLWYNIFNFSVIAKSTSHIVVLLVLIQMFLITLISGYIYSIIYKILDGE